MTNQNITKFRAYEILHTYYKLINTLNNNVIYVCWNCWDSNPKKFALPYIDLKFIYNEIYIIMIKLENQTTKTMYEGVDIIKATNIYNELVNNSEIKDIRLYKRIDGKYTTIKV